MQRVQNEEQIRMNRTTYLFQAVQKREEFHKYATAKKINPTEHITREIQRIERTVTSQRKSRSDSEIFRL